MIIKFIYGYLGRESGKVFILNMNKRPPLLGVALNRYHILKLQNYMIARGIL